MWKILLIIGFLLAGCCNDVTKGIYVIIQPNVQKSDEQVVLTPIGGTSSVSGYTKGSNNYGNDYQKYDIKIDLPTDKDRVSYIVDFGAGKDTFDLLYKRTFRSCNNRIIMEANNLTVTKKLKNYELILEQSSNIK